MSLVVHNPHHMPKRWRGKENTDKVQKEFEALYQYTGMLLLEEMVSILLTPYLLMYSVPKRVVDILQFISEFTVTVDGVGDVCSLSVFDFERHGNKNYASPFSAPPNQRSSQGKMEKSFLSFKICYHSWEPNDHGKVFIASLQQFWEEQMRWQGTYGHEIPHICPLIPNHRTQAEYQNTMTREALFNRVTQGRCCLDSLSMDPNNRPYLLDWYYTFNKSQPNGRRAVSTCPMNRNEDARQDFWFGSSSDNIEPEVRPRCEEDTLRFLEKGRNRSHLDASTSHPFFRDSVLQQASSNMEPATQSHWWARSGQNVIPPPQASFLEPPSFGNHNLNYPCENFSETCDEEEENLNRRSSYRVDRSLKNSHHTHFMDEYDEDELGINLPFNDVLDAPVKNLTIRTMTADD